MSNPSKAKGTSWEVALKTFLNSILGDRTKVYRPAQEGHKDVGDLHGLSPFIGQAKNYRDLASALREGVSGAVVQAAHAGEKWGVAFIKAPRKNVADAYAVMRVIDWTHFYAEHLDLLAENDDLRRRLGE